MKFQILLLLILSSAINLLALDISTTEGTTYKDIQVVKISSVGIRFYCNTKSGFVGLVELTEESKKAVGNYQKHLLEEEKIKIEKEKEQAETRRKPEVKSDSSLPIFGKKDTKVDSATNKKGNDKKQSEAIVPNAKDMPEDEIIKNVNKDSIPSGRISPTIEIGGYGKLDGAILQIISDDLILVDWGLGYIYAVKDSGIGKDKVDKQSVEMNIVRVGTFKYNSIAGVNKQIPLCRVIR